MSNFKKKHVWYLANCECLGRLHCSRHCQQEMWTLWILLNDIFYTLSYFTCRFIKETQTLKKCEKMLMWSIICLLFFFVSICFCGIQKCVLKSTSDILFVCEIFTQPTIQVLSWKYIISSCSWRQSLTVNLFIRLGYWSVEIKR